MLDPLDEFHGQTGQEVFSLRLKPIRPAGTVGRDFDVLRAGFSHPFCDAFRERSRGYAIIGAGDPGWRRCPWSTRPSRRSLQRRRVPPNARPQLVTWWHRRQSGRRNCDQRAPVPSASRKTASGLRRPRPKTHPRRAARFPTGRKPVPRWWSCGRCGPPVPGQPADRSRSRDLRIRERPGNRKSFDPIR